jgi:hypothetical protein
MEFTLWISQEHQKKAFHRHDPESYGETQEKALSALEPKTKKVNSADPGAEHGGPRKKLVKLDH